MDTKCHNLFGDRVRVRVKIRVRDRVRGPNTVAPWPGGPGGPWPPLEKICRIISMLVGNF